MRYRCRPRAGRSHALCIAAALVAATGPIVAAMGQRSRPSGVAAAHHVGGWWRSMRGGTPSAVRERAAEAASGEGEATGAVRPGVMLLAVDQVRRGPAPSERARAVCRRAGQRCRSRARRGATALTGVRDAAAAAVIATATAAAAAARCLTWSGATIKILSPRRCTQRPTRASGPRGTARRRCTPTPTVFWQRCYQAACRRIQVQSEQQGHSACMRTSAFLQEKRGRVRSGTTTLTARASIRERAWTPAGTTAMRRAWL